MHGSGDTLHTDPSFVSLLSYDIIQRFLIPLKTSGSSLLCRLPRTQHVCFDEMYLTDG